MYIYGNSEEPSGIWAPFKGAGVILEAGEMYRAMVHVLSFDFSHAV